MRDEYLGSIAKDGVSFERHGEWYRTGKISTANGNVERKGETY